MCGILFTSDPEISRRRFEAALMQMSHRGPDAHAYDSHGAFQLGHLRLKILDLDDRSNQPFYSSDRRYLMVFNGEIYNYRELAKQHGLILRTTSDTEVIVELYAQFGAKMLDWLNGMFALVIVDTLSGKVFAARDRLGVKPLYMRQSARGTTFASEIAAIVELLGACELDPIGVRQYRKLRTFFNGRTLYRDVVMFPAGSYFENGQMHRYWTLPDGEQMPPEDEELRELIVGAIEARLISDVPVGSYLSGGLDSTIVAAISRTSHTWTVGFSDHNEFPWGRMAAKHIGSIHHEVTISPHEFVELARDMVRRRREPLSVPNEVLLHKMTTEVKMHNTVVLSGEGADELFFGYDRIFRWAENAPQWDVREFERLYAYGSNPDTEIVEDAVRPFLHLKTPIAIVAAFFQCAHLHGLLRRLDNSTMLSSVEARVPFVDEHRLVERMAGVPFSYRMKDGVIKNPLKRLFRDALPVEIIEREKVGFPVPLGSLPLPGAEHETPMDRWLNFNLANIS